MRRVLLFVRAGLHVLAWPFTGELNPRRMSSDQAETELEMMTRANRDQS
jgi:hypothetical protein